MLHRFHHRLPATLLVSIIVALVGHRDVRGQVTESQKQQLLSQIESESANLDALDLPEFETTRAEVLARLEAVDRYLTSSASPENRAAWLRYLDLEPLSEALRDEDAAVEAARAAIDLRYRLIGTAPGLELPALVALRDALERLVDAARYRDPDRSLRFLGSQLDALAKRIEELGENPSSSDLAAMSGILSRLASARQAEATVSSFRSLFGRPNLSVLVDESLIQEVVAQPIDQTSPVRDCILGTRVVGTATLEGAVSIDLLPAADSAQMQLTLTGEVISHSTGYNGPVRLRTVGVGSVVAQQVLWLKDTGIEVTAGSTQAELSTDIRRIEHPLKLVRKIARKRAAQQKPLAERIATGRMRDRVSELFSQRIEETTATVPERLTETRSLLTRLSLHEPARSWNSSDDLLTINATISRHDQLATAVPPPPIDQRFAAAIQFHESVIDNALSPVLAGRTLTEAKLNELLGAVDRSPEAEPTNEEGEPEPPFEIDFADLQPIVFDAREQTIRIGVRGTRFAQGRRELDRSLEITATYRPQQSEDGRLLLVRDEEIDVDFPGRGRLTVTQAGLRPTIKTKFGKVFPDRLLDRELKVPATSAIESLRGRVFEPALVDATDGWLTIGLR